MNPLEIAFPLLAESDYSITSEPTGSYNSIAWAAGESDRWGWPDRSGDYYWPSGAPRDESLAAFLAAFATLGFNPTVDSSRETNVDKVAIYAKSGTPTHAARQLPSGRWTSKLGQAEDIEHNLSDLAGPIYGDVCAILARPVQ